MAIFEHNIGTFKAHLNFTIRSMLLHRILYSKVFAFLEYKRIEHDPGLLLCTTQATLKKAQRCVLYV